MKFKQTIVTIYRIMAGWMFIATAIFTAYLLNKLDGIGPVDTQKLTAFAIRAYVITTIIPGAIMISLRLIFQVALIITIPKIAKLMKERTIHVKEQDKLNATMEALICKLERGETLEILSDDIRNPELQDY